MSIRIGRLPISAFYHNNRAIGAIYKGTRLVWQKSKGEEGISCFSGDYWEDTYPWEDLEIWKY